MSFGTPGVYVEETAPRLNPIIRAGTGVLGMLGFTTRGPVHKPVSLGSFDDFVRVFGKSYANETAEYAVKGYFDNGGSKCYFVRLSAYNTTTGAESANAASITLNTDNAGTFKIESGYRGNASPGLEGNNLFVAVAENPLHPSAGAGNDLNGAISAGDTEFNITGTIGIRAGSLLFLSDSAAADEVVVVRRVASALNAGVVVHTVYLESAVVNAFAIATTTVKSLEYDVQVLDATGTVLESWTSLSLSEFADNNADLVLNDPELGSRYIKTTTTLTAQSKGDLSDAISVDATLSAGKQLAAGTDETVGATSVMFGGSELIGKGLHALDAITEVNLLCAPPTADATINTWGVQADSVYHNLMLAHCEARMDLFAILDAPLAKTPAEIKTYRNTTLGIDSYWGAFYYPHLKIQDPARPQSSATITVPPSGHVAGIYSRVDGIPAPQGGVSAAPAGISDFGYVEGVIGIERLVSDNQQSELNPIGVNCIRLLDRAQGGKGVYVYGARTLSTNNNFKYVPMRRTLTFIEESVRLSTQFGIFKKNGPQLWSELSSVIESFLSQFWREGNLAGGSEREAFFVEINGSTTSNDDIQNGIVRGRIGVSLFRPAEFIVFTFTQTQNGSSVEEG